MSRHKKSRSLKRVTGGVKTGSKEKMKLANKARKAQKKAANPRKVSRPRSVYQKYLDDNGLVETAHSQKPVKTESVEQEQSVAPQSEAPTKKEAKDDLWGQLEKPTGKDIF